jgi:hypothetical protein
MMVFWTFDLHTNEFVFTDFHFPFQSSLAIKCSLFWIEKINGAGVAV